MQETKSDSLASKFREIFYPPIDKGKALSITLDIFGIIFAAVPGGMWNSVIKGLAQQEFWKDVLNSAVSYGITFAKDATSAANPLKTLGDVWPGSLLIRLQRRFINSKSPCLLLF